MESNDDGYVGTFHWVSWAQPVCITEVISELPPPSHTNLLRVSLHLLAPDELGLSRAAERSRIGLAVYDVIELLQTQLGAWWVAIRRGDGRVEVLIALESPSGWRTYVDRALQSACPHHEVGVTVEPDGVEAAWKEASPPEHLLDELPDHDRVFARENRGDVAEAVRPVTITVLLPTADARRELADILPDQGFTLDDLDAGTERLPFGLDVVADLRLWEVPRALADLRSVIAPYGGEVGDWGAPVVDAPPPSPTDEAANAVPAEVQAHVDALSALGPWQRVLTHRLAFRSREGRDAVAAHLRPLGFTLEQSDPPAGVPAIGTPFELHATREDGVGSAAALLADLQDQVWHHDGLYVGVDPHVQPGDPTDVPEWAPATPPGPPETARWRSNRAESVPDVGEVARIGTRVFQSVASLIGPGAGQLQAGRPGPAVAFMVAGFAVPILGGLSVLIPSPWVILVPELTLCAIVALHIISAIDALRCPPPTTTRWFQRGWVIFPLAAGLLFGAYQTLLVTHELTGVPHRVTSAAAAESAGVPPGSVFVVGGVNAPPLEVGAWVVYQDYTGVRVGRVQENSEDPATARVLVIGEGRRQVARPWVIGTARHVGAEP